MVRISINDELLELTGKEAEDFEKDRAEQHAQFLESVARQETAKLEAEQKLQALGLSVADLKALGL